MDTARRAVRVTLSVLALLGLVAIGLVAQAAAYLTGFTTPAADDHLERTAIEGLSHATPGAHPVGIRRLATDDASVAVTVWYPATTATDEHPAMDYSYSLTVVGPTTATALATYEGTARLDAPANREDGPYPLVVLSAGFAITPDSYAWLAEHLASHGLVVVAPRHEETLNPATLWRSAIERPGVVASARAYVATATRGGGDLAGLVDPHTVAVLGHSYGGYTALASAGAQVDADAFGAICATARRDDDPLVFLCDALEPRVDAVVARSSSEPEPVDAVVSLAGDAALFGRPGLASVTAPLLAIGGTADHDSPYDWSTRLAYDAASSARKVEVTLQGAGHFVFSGECGSVRRIVRLVPTGFCDDPTWERARARAVIRHYVAAFLLSELTRSSGSAEVFVDDDVPAGVELRSSGSSPRP